MTSLFFEDRKTAQFPMKDCLWIFIVLIAGKSITNALDRPIWSPDCPSNDSPFVTTFLPHPGDCGKFYQCLNGLAYPVSCPAGLQWNHLLKQCDNLHVTKCQNIKERSFQSEYIPHCPLDENTTNITHFPNRNDCGQYYKCLGGNAYAFTCLGGQHWSVEHNSCENPKLANCQRKQPRSEIEDGFVNTNCPLYDNPFKPTHLPYPGDCAKFYKCSFGRSYVMSCPYGLHWDVKSNRCESPFDAQCNTGPPYPTPPTEPPYTRTTPTIPTIPTMPTIPTTANPIDPNLPLPMPECSDPTIVRKFGIPGQCEFFLQCYQGKAYRIRCREGREWSETARDCIDAALAGCSKNPGSTTNNPIYTRTTPTTVATTQRTTTKMPTSCTEGVEYLTHPTDCHKFIQCDNGKEVPKDCPGGLYWSKRTNNCEWTSDDCR